MMGFCHPQNVLMRTIVTFDGCDVQVEALVPESTRTALTARLPWPYRAATPSSGTTWR